MATLSGCNFDGVDLSGVGLMSAADVMHSTLIGTRFTGAVLEVARGFAQARLANNDFRRADLKQALLGGRTLVGEHSAQHSKMPS